MPHYLRIGLVPPRRHVLVEDGEGQPLFEEFVGEDGFNGSGSLLYHRGVPSSIVDARRWDLGDTSLTRNHPLLPRHIRLPDLFPPGAERGVDAVRGRRLVLGNADVRISYVVADTPSALYSNGIGDEVVFVQSGGAILESVFGRVEVRQGDSVVVPRVSVHRWIPVDVENSGPLRALCVEGRGHIRPPDRYRSRYGQFLPGSPVTERDVRGPQEPLVVDAGECDTEVYVKHRDDSGPVGSVLVYDHHPFDVVGWDGHVYPYAVNYRDFSPVVGRELMPPPTYQMFQGEGFVVCTFVPRPLEFGQDALKVPYYHANVDADEVMFYFHGETAARQGSGIIPGSVSLHPAAFTHGPRRHAYLTSPGLTQVTELAFMVDAFAPLALGEAARAAEISTYPWTWAGRGPVTVAP